MARKKPPRSLRATFGSMEPLAKTSPIAGLKPEIRMSVLAKATLPTPNAPKSTWTPKAEKDGAKESVFQTLHPPSPCQEPRHEVSYTRSVSVPLVVEESGGQNAQSRKQDLHNHARHPVEVMHGRSGTKKVGQLGARVCTRKSPRKAPVAGAKADKSTTVTPPICVDCAG